MKRGMKKGHVLYPKASMPQTAIRMYYYMQDVKIKTGKCPTYYDLGVWLGSDPEKYYTCKSRGRRYIDEYLKPQGYVANGTVHGGLVITDKPFDAFNKEEVQS